MDLFADTKICISIVQLRCVILSDVHLACGLQNWKITSHDPLRLRVASLAKHTVTRWANMHWLTPHWVARRSCSSGGEVPHASRYVWQLLPKYVNVSTVFTWHWPLNENNKFMILRFAYPVQDVAAQNTVKPTSLSSHSTSRWYYSEDICDVLLLSWLVSAPSTKQDIP